MTATPGWASDEQTNLLTAVTVAAAHHPATSQNADDFKSLFRRASDSFPFTLGKSRELGCAKAAKKYRTQKEQEEKQKCRLRKFRHPLHLIYMDKLDC
ncbi:hypothetical protein AVEN_42183-1 [Araneus ventricosus]|uniref:Uncharacterized protein n=1 Tax=Araneus ventricosus TaxID=182803 RepID=A0A4Y2AXY0_ARAVE|nr:hypothetical protein AVEN_42183-1 [Araneus ventricosus]